MKTVETTTVVRCYGVTLALGTDDPRREMEVLEAVPPHSVPVPPGPPAPDEIRLTLSRDGRIHRNGSAFPPEHTSAFAATVRQQVARHAPAHVFIHAGAAVCAGRAIILPGPSWAGKSMLVLELLRAGATYLSDEYAVVDPAGLVHPFHKPIQVRDAQSRDVTVELTAPSAFQVDPVGVGVIAAITYDTSVPPRLRRVEAGDGLMALLQNTVAIRSAPRRILPTLRLLAAGAATVVGTRDEAADTAQQLLRFLETQELA